MKNLYLKISILSIFFLTFYITGFSQNNDSSNSLPPKGKAVIYIVRPSAYGFAVKFKVNCDDVFIGATKGKQYIYMIVDPGEHTILSIAENKSEVKLTVEADKAYYVQQNVAMGAMKARNILEILNEDTGKIALKQSKPAATPKK